MSLSVCNKIWRTRSWDKKQAALLAQQCNLPLPIAAILLQRGLSEPEKIHKFLRPSLDELPNPFLMKDMRQGIEILLRAITHKLPVIIYGDYDVDGTTGIAVLAHFLKHLDVTVHCCQPDRLIDGYGLHNHLIEKANQEIVNQGLPGRGVLITVDCGISDCEEVAFAKSIGLQVIVTDHHQPPANVPPAEAVINPWQPGCQFPFKDLAGVGVAFYLTMALRSHLVKKGIWTTQNAPKLKELLDLVAIGTIADMMPLTETNRILVKAGLEVLQRTEKTGLKALLQVCGLQGKKIKADDIAFQVAPRLNAPGRILGTGLSLELLMTESTATADELASKIDRTNQSRRKQGDALFESGLELAHQQVDSGRKSIVVVGEDWHPGLIGIAATKLAKHFGRPTIAITKNDAIYRGSGRSMPGCNLYEVIKKIANLLENYGGHESAVGLGIKPEYLEIFSEQFEAAVKEQLTEDIQFQDVTIDWHFETQDRIDQNLMQWFNLLGPFGQGNPEPIFSVSMDTLDNKRIVGADHLKFIIRMLTGNDINGIGFQFGKLLPLLNENGSKENLFAFTVKHNTFNGKGEWQAQAVDFLFAKT